MFTFGLSVCIDFAMFIVATPLQLPKVQTASRMIRTARKQRHFNPQARKEQTTGAKVKKNEPKSKTRPKKEPKDSKEQTRSNENYPNHKGAHAVKRY
jgi:hypothetical protein